MIKVEKFVEEYFIDNDIPLFSPRAKKSTVKLAVYGIKKAGWSYTKSTNNWHKKYFPDKPKGQRIYTHILNLNNLKYCYYCEQVKSVEKFSRSSNTCKTCDTEKGRIKYENNKENIKKRHKKWDIDNRGLRNSYTRKYQMVKLQRNPSWADQEKINFFYECCPKDCHVDHVIPLQGKNISGLHIETNLQWLPAIENLRKGNKWL